MVDGSTLFNVSSLTCCALRSGPVTREVSMKVPEDQDETNKEGDYEAAEEINADHAGLLRN